MNYLNEMSDNEKSELVGVMAISIPWNCMESCVSLEQPINSFLFNKHLTRNLVNMLNRYLIVIYMNEKDCAKKNQFSGQLYRLSPTPYANPPPPPVLLQSAFPQNFSLETSIVISKVKDRIC